MILKELENLPGFIIDLITCYSDDTIDDRFRSKTKRNTG